MNCKLLEGRTALITGASKGIGLAIAERFVEEGANLVLTARGEATLNQVVENLKAKGAKVIGVAGDVADTKRCKETFAAAVETFGTIDILVNNAAYSTMYKCDYAPDEELDFLMNINIRGTFIYCREALKIMKEKNSGSIINVSSVNGVRPMCGAVYGMTKGAVNTLTKSIAIECVGTGIRCNVLGPGQTNTPLSTTTLTGGLAADDEKSMIGILKTRTVRNMPCYVDEQADVALFLASDLSRAVTGQIILVDKGQYL